MENMINYLKQMDKKSIYLFIGTLVGLLFIIYVIMQPNFKSNTSQHLKNMPPIVHVPSKQYSAPPPKQESVAPTKQIYKKYDEIVKPSSISGNTGYIGRDYVCFRDKLGDQQFVSKRNGCMACQVDNRLDSDKYVGTNTNVISSCVYTETDDHTDPAVWTYKMCKSECAKAKDVQ
jgi:hypothetical protein